MNYKIITKNFILILVTSLLLWGFGRIYIHLTDGFSMSRITSEHSFHPQWETSPLSSEELEQIQSILHQKFRYLGKGCQNYVFVSEDNKYVIKFFKHQHLRIPFWLSIIPLPLKFEPYRQEKIKEKENKVNTLFNSCLIASEKVKEETGLIYVHLNKTENLHPFVLIVDKLGREHNIDSNKFEFILQRKAELVYPSIVALMVKNKIENAQERLKQLIAVLVARSQKGIADRDPAMIQNLGFLEDRAIILDTGQFFEDNEIKSPIAYQNDIEQRSLNFKCWLRTNYPYLAEPFEEELTMLK